MAASSAAVRSDADRALLTDASVRAAAVLGLRSRDLATVLGVSPRTVERMKRGQYHLDPGRKEWELALLLVRLFRSLHAICAGDEEVVRQWMTHHNDDLEATPMTLIAEVQGLVRTLDHVDSSRAPV